MPYYNSASHGNPIYNNKETAGAGGLSSRETAGPTTTSSSSSGGGLSSSTSPSGAPAAAAAGATDKSTYVMEHLATFTVTKETGIVYPADGMRRLLQLEKSNGIWSQKMQMRLERNWVLIMDNETGAVMERFPAALIQEPTAFTSRDPMEMYNNILVFTVADDVQQQQSQPQQQRAEMHIFQCQSISAQDLVEDLKMLQAGKLASVAANSPRTSRALIPPPPALPPPEPPLNGNGERESSQQQQQQQQQQQHHHHHHHHHHHQEAADASREENNDEVSSTSSDKYERDVTILNHCFDDIEKFIARLQHAAAASRELERRRRNRKSKKRNLGDGMLTMRAKPPPELEFIDIFQKFKLSFNLLAKLKAHIHDPNAPELVHFLFTPLALIVDASHDTNYEANLPAKVASPLLTREAVNLLMNCVTSKETELWHSLGDAWLVPRDQWKGHVPSYHPHFMDGWSPDYPIPPDDRDVPPPVLGLSLHNDHLASLLNADKRKRDDMPIASEHHGEPYYVAHRDVDESHYSSDYLDYESREERACNQEYFDRELYAREAEAGRERDRAHSDISLDSIERGPRTAAAAAAGAQERAQESWLDELLARRAKIVQVTYPRTANNDKELTVVRGEYLEVLDDSRKWWKARNSRGQIAHVPHTIVTPHNHAAASPDSDVFNNPLYATRYQRHSHSYNYEDSEIDAANTSPGSEAPHRAHGIPPPAPADWVRKERLGKKGESSSEGSNNSDTSRELTKHEDIYMELSTSPRFSTKLNNVLPPRPPPLPIGIMSSHNILRRTLTVDSLKIIKTIDSQDQRDRIHEELKHVLTILREKRRITDDNNSQKDEGKKLPYEIQTWNQQRFRSKQS